MSIDWGEWFTDQHPNPVWLMRQAGRYLPEYRLVRATTTGFMDLATSPHKAAEVTLQPLRRFDLSAAIIFSDILVTPWAMGQKLDFVAGEGPRLPPLRTDAEIELLDPTRGEQLTPVTDAVRLTRDALPKDKHLIGFAGAPWTVACYMIEGRGKTGFPTAIDWAQRNDPRLDEISQKLEHITVDYLCAKIEAGASMIKLFDSWAGLVPEARIQELVIAPAQRIFSAIKSRYPHIPLIGFPRGVTVEVIKTYVTQVPIDALAVDESQDMIALADQLPDALVLQGNISPKILIDGGENLLKTVQGLKIAMAERGRKWVCNLGHGIDKTTPIRHVEQFFNATK